MPTPSRRNLGALRTLALASLLAAPAAGRSSGITVSPMELELGAGAQSTAVTLRNDSPAPITFQVRGAAWRQDDEGLDHYEPAAELVFFPRLLTIAPGQQAVVRVGTRQASTAVEKSFRLFLEQQAPPPGSAEGAPAPAGGAQVRFLLSIGLPLFVRPLQPTAGLAMEALSAANGKAHGRIRNTGNSHLRIDAIQMRWEDVQGGAMGAQRWEGRYLLAGTRHAFALPLPASACGKAGRLRLQATVEGKESSGQADIAAPPCD